MFKQLKSTYKYLKRVMNKAVKEGEKNQKTEEKKTRTLGDLRKRQKAVESARLTSLKKNMESKKAKRKHQHRLRSTPGEVDESEATPSFTHKEGLRWIRNTRKKIKTQNKILAKKRAR